MCGRFVRYTSTEALAQQLDAVVRDDLPPSYNIAPTQTVLVARTMRGGRELVGLRWGLVPAWSKGPDSRYSMINARAETVADKPAYRKAFQQRRCLLPADGFYEWQRQAGAKQPYYIHLQERQVFAMAGLWEYWQGGDGSEIESCTILTTSANERVGMIHDRMPVILDPDDYAVWLTGDVAAAGRLLRSFPAERMASYPVSNRVNRPQNNDPECMAALPDRA